MSSLFPASKGFEIANYDDFIQKIPLANESWDLLYRNGFVVIENPAIENLPGAGRFAGKFYL